ARRDRFEPVFGLAAPEREDPRAETDEVPADLHPEHLRGAEVAELVQRDRYADAEGEQDDAEYEHHQRSAPCPTTPPARPRAHSSASSTSPTFAGSPAHRSPAARTSATVAVMAGKRIRPSRNAAAASSLAALNTAGMHPPARPACRARRTAGNTSSSSGSKC